MLSAISSDLGGKPTDDDQECGWDAYKFAFAKDVIDNVITSISSTRAVRGNHYGWAVRMLFDLDVSTTRGIGARILRADAEIGKLIRTS